MDHVYISFDWFLWCHYTVGINAVCMWVSGVSIMLVRRYLYKHGWITPQVCDFKAVAAEFILETTLAVNFKCIQNDQHKTDHPNTIACFEWDHLAILNNCGEMDDTMRLTVHIDLTTRTIRQAYLGGELLLARDLFLLLLFHMALTSHPKIHAYGNWGTNMYHDNQFIQRMSAVTIVYNYFGYTTFPATCALLKAFGLTKFNLHNVQTVLTEGLKRTVPYHGHLSILLPHSDFLTFTYKLRSVFLRKFSKFNSYFYGIDGEALFIGTVLHSLEHSQSARFLLDTLWMAEQDCEPRFALMGDLVQWIRAGFTDELPLLCFNTKIKYACHAFYRDVYKHAHQLNPWLADRMQACIVK
jgi:hypothetical protein